MRLITGLSHVSIVVPDLAAAAAQLEARYGLTTGEPLVNAAQGVRLAYVELPNARIELMEPYGEGSPIAKFLQRNPRGGVHHFSLEVRDVNATVRDLTGAGVRVLGDGRAQSNVHGRRIAFVHPADFLGALVELEEAQEPHSSAREGARK